MLKNSPKIQSDRKFTEEQGICHLTVIGAHHQKIKADELGISLSHEHVGPKISAKFKITSPEQNYFVHFAMRYPVYL